MLIIGEGKYQFAFIDGLVKDCRVTVIVSRMLSEDTKLKYINKGVKIIQKYGDMSIETIFKSLDIRKFNDIFLCDESAIANIEYLKSLSEKLSKYSDAGNSAYQQIHVSSADNSMAELIRQYYDNLDTKLFDLDIHKMRYIRKGILEKNHHPVLSFSLLLLLYQFLK